MSGAKTTRSAAVLAIWIIIAALSACSGSGGGHTDLSPSPTPSPAVSRCSGSDGSNLLRQFSTEFNAGSPKVVSRYFTDSGHFTRWWDPSLPSGTTISRLGQLASHLRSLFERGRRLPAAAQFHAEEQRGRDSGAWFQFASGSKFSGKGAVDCASKRLSVLVIDAWESK